MSQESGRKQTKR